MTENSAILKSELSVNATANMGYHIAGNEVTVHNGRDKQRKDNDGVASHKGNTGQQHHIGQHNNKNKDEDMTMVEEAKNNNNVGQATKKTTTESRNVTNSQNSIPLPQ